MEHVFGICHICHCPTHPKHPCNCHGEYNVGDIYSRKAHECEVMSKHFDTNFNGVIDGCVYLVKIREYGNVDVNYIVLFDGGFNGYTKEGNIYD